MSGTDLAPSRSEPKRAGRIRSKYTGTGRLRYCLRAPVLATCMIIMMCSPSLPGTDNVYGNVQSYLSGTDSVHGNVQPALPRASEQRVRQRWPLLLPAMQATKGGEVAQCIFVFFGITCVDVFGAATCIRRCDMFGFGAVTCLVSAL
eukprot:2529110-Rhodomonas_salina.1